MPLPGEVVLNVEPSAEFPRNSEGSFVTLKDNRLLFIYSQFYGGNRDESAARIVQIESSDGGRSWSPPRTVIDNDAMNLMSVSMLRLQSGAIALFYLIRKSHHDTRTWMRTSRDEGKTWSDPRLIVRAPGYFVLNNDRVIQLRSGRLIAPMAYHRCMAEEGAPLHTVLDLRGAAMWFLSDDDGATWRESKTWWTMPVLSGNGLQEPGVVELADGSIFSWARTDAGCQYGFFSTDGGETFSPPQPTQLLSPLGPCSIKRLPGSGALLAVYNDHSGMFPFTPGIRTPLVAAVSHDGARTWTRRKLLEDDPIGGFHYTAIHFERDAALLAYCAGDRNIGWLNRLRIRRVPVAWFES